MKEKTLIGYYQVKPLVDRIIAKFGTDYRYLDTHAVCRNFDMKGGEYVPSCIVGQVFHLLGIQYNECGPSGNLESAIVKLRDRRPDLEFTQDALLYLGMLQQQQDGGATWGQATVAAQQARYTLRTVARVGKIQTPIIFEFSFDQR